MSRAHAITCSAAARSPGVPARRTPMSRAEDVKVAGESVGRGVQHGLKRIAPLACAPRDQRRKVDGTRDVLQREAGPSTPGNQRQPESRASEAPASRRALVH